MGYLQFNIFYFEISLYLINFYMIYSNKAYIFKSLLVHFYNDVLICEFQFFE